MTEEEMLAAWMPESRDAAEQKSTLLIGRVIMADCAIDQALKGQRTFFKQKEMVIAMRSGRHSNEEDSKAAAPTAKAKCEAERTLWLRDVCRLSAEPEAATIAKRVVSYSECLSKIRNTIAHGLLTVMPPDSRINEYFLWCSNGKIRKRLIKRPPYKSDNLIIEDIFPFVGLSFLEKTLEQCARIRHDMGTITSIVSIDMEKKFPHPV